MAAKSSVAVHSLVSHHLSVGYHPTPRLRSSGLVIALNVSFGIPGQIAGVWIYKPEKATKGYPTGHWALE
ncbi:hypothetical protein PAAG_12598 [Paracoccidioides lutzii Pb01]|uniref:Uncharacterized protein n=1 Tax=Paracoccidioides lutzii (strain ATCC MYA-826 / Pb01) TaxID=502779 RepID=A0A0A2VIK0_PARBA|nr:hypothetical protein PAAG_12598 [Paracoccidioides lutzii Pb01]KGQ00734.1 hypothetical protein PAAG_12598 [Paracoccidioides lutzii Pb01]